MLPKTSDVLQNLIFRALPHDVNVEELKRSAPDSLWSDKPELALENALRNCSRLDWDAYLDANKDVKAAGIDPVSHFLNHGMFEERRIFSHPYGWSSEKHVGPKLSIIITNCNQGQNLQNCLDRLVAQTFADFEIIIVDDASFDTSRAVIEYFSAHYPRIYPVYFTNKQGRHMARKAGVEAASGDFIIFMGTDGSLTPDACSIAICQMMLGYDLVCFTSNDVNVNPEVVSLSPAIQVQTIIGSLNIHNFIFNNIQCYSLYNKIFRSSVCKLSFEQLEDGTFAELDDLYQLILFSSKARTAAVLPGEFYKQTDTAYKFVGTNPVATVSRVDNINMLLPSIERWCAQNCLTNLLEKIKSKVFDFQAKNFLLFSSHQAVEFFYTCSRHYGAEFTVSKFMDVYFDKQAEVARKLSTYPFPLSQKHIKNIAFVYIGLYHGGSEKVLKDQTTALIEFGYNVHVILEQKFQHGIYPDPRIHLHYIHPSLPYTRDNIKNRLVDLNRIIINENIDLVIHVTLIFPGLIWDVMLERLLGVHVIGYQHTDLAFLLGSSASSNSFDDRIQVQRLMDKVVCLSRHAESVLRGLGVDALYVPNGTRLSKEQQNKTHTYPVVAFVGRLDSAQKRVCSALQVLAEVHRSRPDVRLLCIGGFDNSRNEEKFYAQAQQRGLIEYIHVTGWTDDVGHFLNQCRLLLCVSWWEAFPMVLLEAQAKGLPCVMYDLPIPQAEGNPSIIRVPQGDWRAAAAEIILLLDERKKYDELSQIAKEKIARFASEEFTRNTIKLVREFRNFSPLRYDTAQDYRTFLKWTAFYTGRKIPAD